MSPSLRLTSLSSSKLDTLLAQYGAATFGSPERKRQRLQRFIDAQIEREISESRLEFIRQIEYERTRNFDTEEEPPLKRQRTIQGSCPSPDSAPAPSPVRRPAPPSLPGTARMTTRSMNTVRRNSHAMITRSRVF